MKVKVYFENGEQAVYENVSIVSKIKDFRGGEFYVLHLQPKKDCGFTNYLYLKGVKSLEITDK